MANRRMSLPLWLIVLDTFAVVLLAAGGLRLFMPELEMLQVIDEPTAWGLVVAGLAALALFWVFFVRRLHERRAGKP